VQASKPQCESKKGGGGACPIKSSLAGVSAHARQVAKAMERNCCSVQYALEQAPRVKCKCFQPLCVCYPIRIPQS
jgi:hypothetical protein